MQADSGCDPPLDKVQACVDEFVRIFQMSPGCVKALQVYGGVAQLRVICPGGNDPQHDVIRLRLRQHLRFRFAALRSAVIEFVSPDPEGGQA